MSTDNKDICTYGIFRCCDNIFYVSKHSNTSNDIVCLCLIKYIYCINTSAGIQVYWSQTLNSSQQIQLIKQPCPSHKMGPPMCFCSWGCLTMITEYPDRYKTCQDSTHGKVINIPTASSELNSETLVLEPVKCFCTGQLCSDSWP